MESQYNEYDDFDSDDKQFVHDLEIDLKAAGLEEYIIKEIQATMIMDYLLDLSNDLRPTTETIAKECNCIYSLIFVDPLLL